MHDISDGHTFPRSIYLPNLAVRFLLELAALVILAAWAWHVADGFVAVLLAAALVLGVSVAWGMFVAPRRVVETAPLLLRLGVEACVFGAASAAAGATWGAAAGIAFAVVALLSGVVDHA